MSGEFVLRDHRPGDIGRVIARHGEIYAAEFGWDASFEGLVARILGEFLERGDTHGERSFIAESDGRFAGAVFVMRRDAETAQLRCLLVEPSARGAGLGTRLVDACVDFARDTGYRRITLWTNDVLHAARRLYERAGFTLVDETPQRLFGHDVTSQNWTLEFRNVVPRRSEG